MVLYNDTIVKGGIFSGFFSKRRKVRQGRKGNSRRIINHERHGQDGRAEWNHSPVCRNIAFLPLNKISVHDILGMMMYKGYTGKAEYLEYIYLCLFEP